MAKLLTIKPELLPRVDSAALVSDIGIQFREAGFAVAIQLRSRRKRRSPDLVVSRREYGQLRHFGVEVKAMDVEANVVRRAREYLHGDEIDELWIVGPTFSKEARTIPSRGESIRLFTFGELKKALAQELNQASQRENKRKTPKARTTIGKAVSANYTQILFMSTSLLLLIDEKLESLGSTKPNSREAIAERDDAIVHLKQLKRNLMGLRHAADEFSAGHGHEQEVEAKTKSLSAGLRRWWDKCSEKICAKSFDMALFAGGVAICSAAGASASISVVISAAMVGGKPIAGALKSISKKALS